MKRLREGKGREDKGNEKSNGHHKEKIEMLIDKIERTTKEITKETTKVLWIKTV